MAQEFLVLEQCHALDLIKEKGFKPPDRVSFQRSPKTRCKKCKGNSNMFLVSEEKGELFHPAFYACLSCRHVHKIGGP